MVELSVVSIWDVNILSDKTYDIDEIIDTIHYVLGGLIMDDIFDVLKNKAFSANIPQIGCICDIINASQYRTDYIYLFYQAIKKCKLDQFIKYIESRTEPQYLLMLNGWSYTIQGRVIIQNKMPTHATADFAFLVQHAIQTLAEIKDSFIYNTMKSELINFLIKMSYSVTDEELYAFVNGVSLNEKQYIILMECLPIKIHNRLSALI
jgi:hypothetical protein